MLATSPVRCSAALAVLLPACSLMTGDYELTGGGKTATNDGGNGALSTASTTTDAAIPGAEVGDGAPGPDAALLDAEASGPEASDAPDVADAAPMSTSCTLQPSGPVVATADGQVIQNLRITSTSGDGLTISGKKNVIVRNVEIFHDGGRGIQFSQADGIRIENVRVTFTGAPPSGANPSYEMSNIAGDDSSGVVIDRVRVERGSAGIYLYQCAAPEVRFIEAHDIRGPFPRGACVEFNHCSSPVLEDFSCENSPLTSWTEHNINFFESANGIARRGLIVGNNAPFGCGVMFDTPTLTNLGGLVEDVDTVDMGNGSFGAYPSANVTFRRTRSRDSHCGGQSGRPVPSSSSVIYGVSSDSTNVQLEQGAYYNHCNPGNLVWDASRFTKLELVDQSFTARPAQRIALCWSPPAF